MGVAEGLKKLFFQKRRVYPTQDFPIILKSFKKHYKYNNDKKTFVELTTLSTRLFQKCISFDQS
ncbi:hypothetical protein V1478_019007 [Vespula squamosa]|uniref:Uncharacterized protein n=1 Tax=Vespula squamosa TaxID=30214 RepID=A0ABD1ZV77_VESSQ